MIKAKKRFGQHFLNDSDAVEKIIESLRYADRSDYIIEVGPGMGVLTKQLNEKFGDKFRAIEIDKELCDYLKGKIQGIEARLINEDFLKIDLAKFNGLISVIGNFPYNISSQIVFKVIECRQQVNEMVGMFQKEMAKRIVAGPGSKDYGIISVMSECYYDREYLFELPESAFKPAPKVKSAVIRLTKNEVVHLKCDETRLKQVVKTAFNQRRKKLRNSLKSLISEDLRNDKIFDQRPEQLGLDDFIRITSKIENE